MANSVLFEKLIFESDLNILRTILDIKYLNKSVNNLSDEEIENTRFLTDDFKNSIIVRSMEVLNDLNINPIKKLNKFEGFDQSKR